MSVRFAAIAIVAACGARAPQQSWIERDVHATEGTAGGTPVHVDLSKIDPEAISDDAELRALLARAGDAAPAGKLALRAARLAHHRGDDAEARAFVARAASAADEPSVHAELAALAAELAEPPVDAAVVAVLLPLSGRFAAIGAEARAAIELAPADGARWSFVDTRGEADGAAAAVARARELGAIAIVGPIGAREAIAAARAAALRRMPIALLAPDDGADPAAGVFRLAGSPADEGRAVAELAARDGFPTVAVFAPRDDAGDDAAAAFAARAVELGLYVAKRAGYDPTGGDLAPDVKELLDLVPARNARLAEHLRKNPRKGWQTFSPDVPFSLLYIPDRYDRAAIVAAFLPYFGVELRTTEFPDHAMLARKHGGHLPQVVQLVGGAGWHHATLPVRGGTAVQGALVVDAFAVELGDDAALAFAQAFKQKTGREPSSYAAEVFDAAALVSSARRAAAAAPGDPREAMRVELARARLADGACGAAAVDPAGELVRTPSVLQVRGDELTPQ
jgi:ABC-type branched-subunit amino acid transport system substrate-binding protein